ncbi:Hypothetical protein SMAX5B_001656 [Scophthalmus maximus]|uniref:Uncharacterized protein n=1 Tax=Scophthalmus maximus TaxID=52904 RepID=A0A2U9CVT6_SCOMX|nr:Hypothetical protein SMAX5B_001656 [Scophthalmus maximus]
MRQVETTNFPLIQKEVFNQCSQKVLKAQVLPRGTHPHRLQQNSWTVPPGLSDPRSQGQKVSKSR